MNGLFGVLEVVIATEKGDVGGGANLPDVAGKLYAGDKGHPDIGQQQVGFVLFYHLESVQSVAGTAQQFEAVFLPGDHSTNRFAQFILIISDDQCIECFCGHGMPILSETKTS